VIADAWASDDGESCGLDALERVSPLETESRSTKTLAGRDEHRLGSTSSRA
jgi:hypothetical protein